MFPGGVPHPRQAMVEDDAIRDGHTERRECRWCEGEHENSIRTVQSFAIVGTVI